MFHFSSTGFIRETSSIESSAQLDIIDEAKIDLFELQHLDIADEQDDNASNDDLFSLIDPLFDDLSFSTDSSNNVDVLQNDDAALHAYTSVKTFAFCRRFLSLIRESNVCKTKSDACLKMIHAILPQPNNLPSSMEKLLLMLNVDKNLFQRRVVCVLCQTELSLNDIRCSNCDLESNENLVFIYDIDLSYYLFNIVKRLQKHILEYSAVIKLGVDAEETHDVPFGTLYQQLIRRYADQHLISAMLHRDGISITKSSKLKLWLLSFSIIELPPLLRFARHNMPIVSIWIGYRDPKASLWLDKSISTLHKLKSSGMHSLCVFFCD